MKSSNGSPRHRRQRTSLSRRTQLLAAFDRSGLSAAAFARQHDISYTTFCGWRHRQTKAKASPGFIEVELPGPTAAVELLIEVGAHSVCASLPPLRWNWQPGCCTTSTP